MEIKCVTHPGVPDGCPRAFYVQKLDESHADMQFTLVIALCYVLHRSCSRVIHLQWFLCEKKMLSAKQDEPAHSDQADLVTALTNGDVPRAVIVIQLLLSL